MGFCSIHPVRAVDAPGGGFWRGCGQTASRRGELRPQFHTEIHGSSGARPVLYLPLIRRIYHKSEPPRPRSIGLERGAGLFWGYGGAIGMTKRKTAVRREPAVANLPEANLRNQRKD